jgi:hypothetical protein
MPDEDICPKCGQVMRLHSKIAGCPAPVMPVYPAGAPLEDVCESASSPSLDG